MEKELNTEHDFKQNEQHKKARERFKKNLILFIIAFIVCCFFPNAFLILIVIISFFTGIINLFLYLISLIKQIKTEQSDAGFIEKNEIKIFITIAVLSVIFMVIFLSNSNGDENQNTVTTSINESVKTREKPPKEKSKAGESRLNNVDISTLAVEGKLTSDGLTKADIAYWALNSYGYDCSEVKSVKNVNYDRDKNFQYLFESDIDANGFVKGYKTFVYKEIVCTSGIKLKLYKRVDNYPYIVEY